MMEIDQKTLIIGIICLFAIGLLLGVLAAFYIIQQPLNEHYQAELARITDNGKLRCFDLSNMTFTGQPIVVDNLNFRQFCDNDKINTWTYNITR